MPFSLLSESQYTPQFPTALTNVLSESAAKPQKVIAIDMCTWPLPSFYGRFFLPVLPMPTTTPALVLIEDSIPLATGGQGRREERFESPVP